MKNSTKTIGVILAVALSCSVLCGATFASKDDVQASETTEVSVAALAAKETTTEDVTKVVTTTEPTTEKETEVTTVNQPKKTSTTKVETTVKKETTTTKPVKKSKPKESTTKGKDAKGYYNKVKLEYSKVYKITSNKLTKRGGVAHYGGHKETWYSQKVLPGKGLKIPGRHVADDGTIRDKDGFICVACNTSYKSKGTKLMTSLGPAKVYDSGCAYGTVDIYVNW